jgi:Flp pilus assembly pilin Flp
MENFRKRGLRHSVELDASVMRGNGADVAVVVTDLSLDGCCLVGQLQIGEQVTVKIPKVGNLVGEVRWAFMGRAGIRFLSETKRKLDSRGAAAIEYALVASLIALALLAAFSRLGGEVETKFNSVDNAFSEGISYDI